MNYTANGSNNKQGNEGKQLWGSLHVRDMIVRSSGVLRTIISYIIQHVWLEICSKSKIKWKELPYMPFVPRICIYIYLCKYTRLCFVFTKLLETTENILSMWSFPESQWELWVMLHSPSVMISQQYKGYYLGCSVLYRPAIRLNCRHITLRVKRSRPSKVV